MPKSYQPFQPWFWWYENWFCQNPNPTSTQPNPNKSLGFTQKWLGTPPTTTTTHHHRKLNVGNISAVTGLISTKLNGSFLGPYWTDCHNDICPGNICPGDICPFQKYLWCYWPNFHQIIFWGSWVCWPTFFGPKVFGPTILI